MEVGISEFKAKCIEMLKATAANGQELIVTRRGKPLARVVGVRPQGPRVLGAQRGAVDDSTPDAMLMDSDLENDWES